MEKHKRVILLLAILFVPCHSQLFTVQQESISGKYSYVHSNSTLHISFEFINDSIFRFNEISHMEQKIFEGYF